MAHNPAGNQAFKERTVIISGLSATFAKDHDLIGSQDPYLTLKLSGDEVTTKVIKSGGINPVWPAEEGYRLHDRGEHPDLIVHAWNKNSLLKDSSLGEGKIPMIQLGSGQQHTVPLFDKKGKHCGELKFKAQEEQAGQFGSQGTGGLAAAPGGAGVAGAIPAGTRDHRMHDTSRDSNTAHLHMGRETETIVASGIRDRQADNTRASQTAHLHQGVAPGNQTAVTGGAYNRQGVPSSGNGQTAHLHQGQGQGSNAAVGVTGMAGAYPHQGRTVRDGETAHVHQGQGQGSNIAAAGAAGMAGAYPHQGQTTRDGETAHLHQGQGQGQRPNIAAGAASTYPHQGQTTRDGETTHQHQGGVPAGNADQMGRFGNPQVDNAGNTMTSNSGNTESGTSSRSGGIETTTNKHTTETVDTNVNESSEHYHKGGGAAVHLESSDDHWQKSLEAAAAARRQAQIVEETARLTHEKLLSPQEATRSFEKARREHMAIQERLAALDLESKRAAFARSSEAYEAHKAWLRGKAQEVDAAQQQANALRAAVNEKGEALDAEVSETKLHQSRLAELEAELARLAGLHADVDRAHKSALAEIEPKRAHQRTLQEQFAHIQAELTDHQRRRAQMEAKEREMQALLETHNAEYSTTRTDIAEMEEMGSKKAAEIEARRGDVSNLEAEAKQVQSQLAEHRQRIGVLKEETEATLANASQLAESAARKEAELQSAQQSMGEKESAADAAAAALSDAHAQKAPLEEKVRKVTDSVDRQKTVTEELHRKLGMAKEQVDLAQARKEELWEKAKWHGEEADKASDTHFLHAHADHKFLSGGDTYDAERLTRHGTATATVLDKAGVKLGF